MHRQRAALSEEVESWLTVGAKKRTSMRLKCRRPDRAVFRTDLPCRHKDRSTRELQLACKEWPSSCDPVKI